PQRAQGTREDAGDEQLRVEDVVEHGLRAGEAEVQRREQAALVVIDVDRVVVAVDDGAVAYGDAVELAVAEDVGLAPAPVLDVGEEAGPVADLVPVLG